MKKASQTRLAETKSYQIENFEKYKTEYKNIFETINKYESDYVVPFWKEINNQVGGEFSNNLPFDFLCHKHICSTMFSTNTGWADDQLKHIYKNIVSFNTEVIEEDLVGDPLILDEIYCGSCNTIHHLYHFFKYYENDRKITSSNINTIVEIGGGYGRYPIFLERLSQIKSKLINKYNTYIIIDVPAFSALQYVYINSIEPNKAKVLLHKDDCIEEGKVNLVPIGLIDSVKDIKADMFIAMWSLSESASKLVEFVQDNNFFNADKIYTAFHPYVDNMLPSGNLLYNILAEKCKLVPVGFTNHFYGFK